VMDRQGYVFHSLVPPASEEWRLAAMDGCWKYSLTHAARNRRIGNAGCEDNSLIGREETTMSTLGAEEC
jgi:hypothetical protein